VNERNLWFGVAVVLVAAGIASLIKVAGEEHVGYEIPVSLAATLASGAAGLSGLVLLERARLAPLAVVLLLTAPVTYALFQLAIWDLSFAEEHGRIVGTAAIAVVSGALVGTLAAMVRDSAAPLRLVTASAFVLILAATAYGIALVWTRPVGNGKVRVEEVLTILALVAYFGAPALQRALRVTPKEGSPEEEGPPEPLPESPPEAPSDSPTEAL
jgi:hypothetical protein